MRTIKSALECPKRIAGERLLNLDDVSAQICQQHASCWTGDKGALFYNLYSFKNFAHEMLSSVSDCACIVKGWRDPSEISEL